MARCGKEMVVCIYSGGIARTLPRFSSSYATVHSLLQNRRVYWKFVAMSCQNDCLGAEWKSSYARVIIMVGKN